MLGRFLLEESCHPRGARCCAKSRRSWPPPVTARSRKQGSAGLTQSAVSEQIRRLEDFVGRRLFFRTGRSAMLNADGQDLVPLADQIVALVAEMRGRHPVSSIRRTLRVGTIASLHSGLLAARCSPSTEVFRA